MSGAGKHRDVRAERTGVTVPTPLLGPRRGHRCRCWCEKLAGGWEVRLDPARGSQEHDGLSEPLPAQLRSDHERRGRLLPLGKAWFCLLIWLMKNAAAPCRVQGIGFSSEFSALVPGEGRIHPQFCVKGQGECPETRALSHITSPSLSLYHSPVSYPCLTSYPCPTSLSHIPVSHPCPRPHPTAPGRILNPTGRASSGSPAQSRILNPSGMGSSRVPSTEQDAKSFRKRFQQCPGHGAGS